MDTGSLFTLDNMVLLNWLGSDLTKDLPCITRDSASGCIASSNLGDESMTRNDLNRVNATESLVNEPQNVNSEDTARAAWVANKRQKVLPDILSEPQIITVHEFPNTSKIRIDTPNNYWTEAAYSNIAQLVKHASVLKPSIGLSSVLFPRMEVMDHFIDLYLEMFQPTFPLLHKPTVDYNDAMLILAIATIGSRFTDNHTLRACEKPLLEVLTACLSLKDVHKEIVSLHTRILQIVAMLFSGDKDYFQIALVKHGNLVEVYRQQGTDNSYLQSHNLADWHRWMQVEGHRRSFYCVWLLDAMLPYHFEHDSHFSSNSAQIPLPCLERIWDAKSAEEWEDLSTVIEHRTPPSLDIAVQTLFTQKELDFHIGEFARVLILHGTHQEIASIGKYFSRPLANWNPTRGKENKVSIDKDIWLPANPTFSKYRNATCDCLDVLHGASISSSIEATASLENPTVLQIQLHVARLVVLTPYAQIKALLMNDTPNAWREVWRWRYEDRYKARLALVHAGIVFRWIKRHSTKSFYEPNAIFLAVLTLWAYGAMSEEPAMSQSPEPRENETKIVIRLDRMEDDKYVRKFVRDRGNQYTARMSDVGDICSKDSPQEILRWGGKILRGLSAWGCAEMYASMLEQYIRGLELEQ